MIEILTYAIDDPAAVLQQRYTKGFPVVACKLPWNWGGAEGLPMFVKVRITDTDDVSGWCEEWRRKAAYTILEHDPASDFFRVKIFSDSAVAPLTKAVMEQFLLSWGAESVIDADGGVVFELTAMDAIQSKGLFTFGAEDDFMRYTETAYDAVSGDHTVELDYSLSTVTEAVVRSTLEQADMTVVSIDHDKGKCIFIGSRNKMIVILENQVAAKFNTMIARALWRFSDTTVINAIGRGGVLEMTEAEASADMIDVSKEV